jgi:sulfoxide reductase catalytic subunit YedY
MLIKRMRGWEIAERDATPESTYMNRRSLVKALAAGPLLAMGGGLAGCWDEATASNPTQIVDVPPDPSAHLYPVKRNLRYKVERQIPQKHLPRRSSPQDPPMDGNLRRHGRETRQHRH